MRVDAIEAAHRRCGVARHTIGGVRIVLIEQLAHQQAPLQPPLVEIDQRLGILRRGEDQLAGFFRLVVLA